MGSSYLEMEFGIMRAPDMYTDMEGGNYKKWVASEWLDDFVLYKDAHGAKRWETEEGSKLVGVSGYMVHSLFWIEWHNCTKRDAFALINFSIQAWDCLGGFRETFHPRSEVEKAMLYGIMVGLGVV